jgi:hypothetical protein
VRRRARLAAIVLVLAAAAATGLATGASCQNWNLDIDAAMDVVGIAPGMMSISKHLIIVLKPRAGASDAPPVAPRSAPAP